MVIPNYLYKPYLEEGEKVLYVCHRHPAVIMTDLLKILAIGIVIPIFLYTLFPEYMMFFVLWLVVSFARITRVMIIWYHDAMLITTASLLDVCWKTLFDREATRLEYQHVEGVAYKKSRFWQVVLNYGDISVQRPGGASDFSLPDCINPKNAERKIMQYQDKFVTDKGLRDSEALKDILTNVIQNHVTTGEAEES